jgi:hypothetical protein
MKTWSFGRSALVAIALGLPVVTPALADDDMGMGGGGMDWGGLIGGAIGDVMGAIGDGGYDGGYGGGYDGGYGGYDPGYSYGYPSSGYYSPAPTYSASPPRAAAPPKAPPPRNRKPRVKSPGTAASSPPPRNSMPRKKPHPDGTAQAGMTQPGTTQSGTTPSSPPRNPLPRKKPHADSTAQASATPSSTKQSSKPRKPYAPKVSKLANDEPVDRLERPKPSDKLKHQPSETELLTRVIEILIEDGRHQGPKRSDEYITVHPTDQYPGQVTMRSLHPTDQYPGQVTQDPNSDPGNQLVTAVIHADIVDLQQNQQRQVEVLQNAVPGSQEVDRLIAQLPNPPYDDETKRNIGAAVRAGNVDVLNGLRRGNAPSAAFTRLVQIATANREVDNVDRMSLRGTLTRDDVDRAARALEPFVGNNPAENNRVQQALGGLLASSFAINNSRNDQRNRPTANNQPPRMPTRPSQPVATSPRMPRPIPPVRPPQSFGPQMAGPGMAGPGMVGPQSAVPQYPAAQPMPVPAAGPVAAAAPAPSPASAQPVAAAPAPAPTPTAPQLASSQPGAPIPGPATSGQQPNGPMPATPSAAAPAPMMPQAGPAPSGGSRRTGSRPATQMAGGQPARANVGQPGAGSASGAVAAAGLPIVLLNADSEDSIQYRLNGSEQEMPAGYQQLLAGDTTWLVEFDRGGEFGMANYKLTSGTYRFKVTDRGWELFRKNEKAKAAVPQPAIEEALSDNRK